MTTKGRDSLILAAAALLPLLLYVVAGYGGHDFKYHAASWLELHDAWRAHQWSLGWSKWAQYGFGEPRYSFYPPISLLVGTGLSFLLPFRLVPAAVVWLLFLLSGLSMYAAAGRFVAQSLRLHAALLYMFNPYLLMTVVIRFAIAEAWVQAILPLVFVYFYVAIVERRWRLIGIAGCLLAACWLTNIPEAIGVFYAFGLLAVVFSLRMKSIESILIGAAAQVTGLLLAAFRLLPALQEKSWVSSANLLIYDFRSFMQLKRVPPPHLTVYVCTVYVALSLALLAPAVRQIVRRERAWPPAIVALVVLAGFAILFQLPVTTPLWAHVPQFKFILFPYRLLAFLSLALVLLVLNAGVSAQLQKIATMCFVCFALVPFAAYTRLLPMQRFHSIAAATARWQTGYEGVREYVPVQVPAALAEPDMERQLAPEGPFHGAACRPELREASSNEKVVRTESEAACTLVLNTYYYPFWQAHLETGAALAVSPTEAGLLQMEVPAGRHAVRLNFVPRSDLRSASEVFSLVVLVGVLAGSWFTRRDVLSVLSFKQQGA